MGCINKAAISGNLTRDPELRTTQSGTSVLSMAVAVNERVKRGDQWEDRPSYVDVTVWGARAGPCAGTCSAPLRVAVSGRLRQDRWQDKQTGENRSRLGIVADEVDVMTPRDRGQERQEPAQPQVARTPYAAPPAAPADPYDCLLYTSPSPRD